MHVQSALHLMIEVQLILFMVSYCIVVFTYLRETEIVKPLHFNRAVTMVTKRMSVTDTCTHCLVNPVIIFLSLYLIVSNGTVASRSVAVTSPSNMHCMNGAVEHPRCEHPGGSFRGLIHRAPPRRCPQ